MARDLIDIERKNHSLTIHVGKAPATIGQLLRRLGVMAQPEDELMPTDGLIDALAHGKDYATKPPTVEPFAPDGRASD